MSGPELEVAIPEVVSIEPAPEQPGRQSGLRLGVAIRAKWGLIRVAMRLLGQDGEADASRARWRRALVTTLSTFGARGLSIVIGLVSVPLTLRYLGAERYGMWMTISSAVVLLVFADLGLGSGVVNAVSQADAAEDPRRAQEVVSTAFFMLSGVALFAGLVFLSLSRVVSWSAVFNVKSLTARMDLPPTMAVILCCFVINLPLGVVQRVQIGYQEGYRNNLWQMGGNVVGLCGILTAIRCKAGLPWLVLCMTGGQALAMLCNFINQFYRVRPWLRPRLALVNWSTCRDLMRVGMIFCGLTIAALLGTSTDDLVIAHVCGPAAVARYDTVYKLSSLTLVIQYFTAPLWPAFSEAHRRGDGIWLRSAFRRATGIAGLAATVMCVLFMLLGRTVVRLWVGPALVPSSFLLLGFCCYRLVTGLSEAAVSVLNTAPLVRTHLLIAGIASTVALAAKILAARYAGIEGVIWATAIAYGLLFSAPAVITVDRWSYHFARRIPPEA